MDGAWGDDLGVGILAFVAYEEEADEDVDRGFFFLGDGGVADAELEEEAIELGFWEGVGAFVLDGVLGGEDGEGVVELAGDAIYGDLFFLHGCEQGGLGFGWCAVDLVSKHHVRKQRSAAKMKAVVARIENWYAGNIRGQQVRCKLNA